MNNGIVHILTKSKALAKKNWTKGSYFADGAVCMAGAIGRFIGLEGNIPATFNASGVATDHNGSTGNNDGLKEGLTKGDLLSSAKAMKYLAYAIGQHVKSLNLGEDDDRECYILVEENDHIGQVTGFNDADETTKKDVLACFDRAIRNARRGHYDGR